MDRIFFANKQHTRSAGCDPLWPAPDKRMMRLPDNFFDEPGLVCYINPKLLHQNYFIAHFYIYAAERMRMHEYGPYGVGREAMRIFQGSPILTAGLIKGVLSTQSIIDNSTMQPLEARIEPMDLEMTWRATQASIALLRSAVDMFNEKFPKQQYQ